MLFDGPRNSPDQHNSNAEAFWTRPESSPVVEGGNLGSFSFPPDNTSPLVQIGQHEEALSPVSFLNREDKPVLATQDLEFGDVKTVDAELIPLSQLFSFSTNLTVFQRVKWFMRHPMDVIQALSKQADIAKASVALRERIELIMEDDRVVRESVLQLLKTSQSGVFQIPFGNPAPSLIGNWTIFGRSISRPITLSDGSLWSVVFKGVATHKDLSCPIELCPNRMDFIPIPGRRSLDPYSSWVLRGGEALHATKNEIINAYGLRAVYSFFGVIADTAVPLGAFKMDHIPCVGSDSRTTARMPSKIYFLNQYLKLIDQDKLRFLRFLRLDMGAQVSIKQHADIEATLRDRNIQKANSLVTALLETWAPVVYGYLVKGDVNARVENWDLRPIPFHLVKIRTTKNQILDAYGRLESSPFEIAKQFARTLSQAAFYHRMGGDFGSRRASLSPKDVTITGSILDLHANMLPGAGGFIYRLILHPLKRRWNLINGIKTVEIFGQSLELSPEQIAVAVNEFEQAYAMNYKRHPDMSCPYRSPFLHKDRIADKVIR